MVNDKVNCKKNKNVETDNNQMNIKNSNGVKKENPKEDDLFSLIEGKEINNALDKSGRVYLVGNLKQTNPNYLKFFNPKDTETSEYEIGISKYKKFKADKAHYHSKNCEYNYVVKGCLKIYFFPSDDSIGNDQIGFDPKREKEIKAGSMFIIPPNTRYICKAKAGTEVIFSKTPGGNDKVVYDYTKFKMSGWAKSWNYNPKKDGNLSYSGDKNQKGPLNLLKRFIEYVNTIFLIIIGDLLKLAAVIGYIITFVLSVVDSFGWLKPTENDGVIMIFLKNSKIRYAIILFAVLMVVSIILFIKAAITANKNILTFEQNGHKLTVMNQGYSDNMKYIINDKSKDIGKIVFAMGVDRNGKLETSTKSGVMSHVIKFMTENLQIKADDIYGIFKKEIMEKYKIDEEELDNTNDVMNLGDTIFCRIPLKSNDTEAEDAKLNFIFVANSGKIGDDQDDQTITDDCSDSRTSIAASFQMFRKIKREKNYNFDTLVIPAMGTGKKGLKFPYAIAISEIINGFEYAIMEDDEDEPTDCQPKEVILSIRYDDYKKNGCFTKSGMINFIKNQLKLYEKSRKRNALNKIK